MKRHTRRSLSFNIPALFIISYAIIAIVIVVVVYERFERRMISDYLRMAEGVTQLMENAYDTELTEEFIEKNFSMQEYKDTLQYYYTLKENYPDIYYMYVYRFEEADQPIATVIIDLDEEYRDPPLQESIDWVGDIYEVDEPFASEIETMVTGSRAVSHAVNTQDGEYLFSYVRPVFDKDGNYNCSVCVDFSMADVHNQDISFLIRLMSILGILMVIILYLNIRFVTKKVTIPLDKMSNCISRFVYETEADRFNNVQRLESLDFRQNDEIGMLYSSFVNSMKESLYYMSNYNKARGEIEYKEKEIEKISSMTYRDALTNAFNKAACIDEENKINTEIASGEKDVAAIMVDINNLKYVNDTFGHEEGDSYIIGCFGIIKDIFKDNSIYRIGGDEFLIFLKGDVFAERHKLFDRLNKVFADSFKKENVQPWEKYSASAGMASYQEGDKIADIVVRADKMMYENKIKFKKINGSYR